MLANLLNIGKLCGRNWFRNPKNLTFARNFTKNTANDMNTAYYLLSVTVLAGGAAFAAVPLYRIFCQKTSFGGVTQIADDVERIATMEKVKERLIRVQFSAHTPASMQWHFKPSQRELYVHPGETALAFYTAINPTKKPIIGISSYNITPFEAAYHFNKIQCFCFEEQILNPGEEVDLPVFFYIDPDYATDPNLESVDNIVLNYTFFESKSGLKLPDPFDPTNQITVKDLKEMEKKK